MPSTMERTLGRKPFVTVAQRAKGRYGPSIRKPMVGVSERACAMSSVISLPVESRQHVGRGLELDVLLKLYDEIRAGRGATAIVTGDAGIGKSRLIEALRQRIAGAEPMIYVGQCFENLATAFAPVAELLNDVLKLPAQSSLNAEIESPQLKGEKLRYFGAVVDGLRRLAQRRAIVLVLEDTQWADAATLELVEFIAFRMRTAPVMMIVTTRSGTQDEAAALRFQARLQRHGATTIELRGLGRDEVRELIFRATRGRPALPVELRRQIENAADGNPLYIEEMLRAALDQVGKSTRSVTVPVTLRAIVRQRMDGFSARDVQLLRTAAVIGNTFDVKLLCAISGMPARMVAEALQVARDHELLVESARASSILAFRHSLIREALYEDILADFAREIHQQIAEILDRRGTASASELAYHWACARVDEKAVHYNEIAGDESMRVLACHDAARFYRKALQFEYPSGVGLAKLYEKLANALRGDGEVEEAGQWLEAALEEHTKAGNLAARPQLLIDIARLEWYQSNTHEFLMKASRAFELVLQSSDVSAIVQSHIDKARILITLGKAEDAQTELQSVGTSVDDLGLRWQTELAEISGETMAALDDSRSAMQHYEHARDLADRGGNVEALVRIEVVHGIDAADLGLTDIAVSAHQRALAIVARSSLTWREAYTRLCAAYTLFLTGELARARDLVTATVAQGIDNATLRTRSVTAGMRVALLLEDTDLLAELADPRTIDEAFRSREPQRIAGVVGPFAALYASQGRLEEASALLDRACENIDRLHRAWPFVLDTGLYGSAAALAEVRKMAKRRAKSGESHVAPAFAAIATALYSRRFGDGSIVAREGQIAATHFRNLRWPYFEAIAHELAGNPTEARAINLRIGNRLALRAPANRRDAAAMLTSRQLQIAELVSDGLTNKEIGARLCISENTVENHLATSFQKLNLRSRSQLAVYARKPENHPARPA
jgi:predicted ATPase/DNA-binding NarL/FixJ family response regulator